MKGISALFQSLVAVAAGVAAVVSLGGTSLQSIEGALLKHVPHVNVPAAVPSLKRTPAPSAESTVAKEGSGAKALGAFVVGRVLPAVGGFMAGSEIADAHGDALNDAANKVLPGKDVGGMIKQKPGDCYVETPQGNVHMSCDEAKRQGKR